MGRLQKELDVACAAVQHCAVLTKHIQKNTVAQHGQIAKPDFSPVTVGDFASQALLTAAIHGLFEDDKFIGEESADQLRESPQLLEQIWQLCENAQPAFSASNLATPVSKEELLDMIDFGGKNESSSNGRTWVFDPIDGTATFLKGQQYAINCAFLIDGREEIGIIGCPNVIASSDTITEEEIDKEGLGVMIYAVRGEGAWVRSMRSDGQLAPATKLERHGDTAKPDRLIWSDCSTYTSTILLLHQKLAAKINTSWPGVDLFSSLMKYAALGLGRSHIVIRIFRYGSWASNMWDHAGGVLIFEEVGGKVTDLEGKPIDFTTGRKMANIGAADDPELRAVQWSYSVGQMSYRHAIRHSSCSQLPRVKEEALSNLQRLGCKRSALQVCFVYDVEPSRTYFSIVQIAHTGQILRNLNMHLQLILTSLPYIAAYTSGASHKNQNSHCLDDAEAKALVDSFDAISEQRPGWERMARRKYAPNFQFISEALIFLRQGVLRGIHILTVHNR
ncbi:hypothetical protein AC579_4477 [Pseudocercospora musae]|uniref:3'(2'),5'-bisphosphate nucleotidase n=1 Tax=Pseudocercospora musae TaxID=113226 RepID=A0A139GWI3_9PEZI|nr:hypothetical protein AC579_4477 [Pseudocercospora musae]